MPRRTRRTRRTHASRTPVPTPVNPLTSEQYVAIHGMRCPYCNSSRIEGDDTDFFEGSMTQEITCLSCHAEWYDRYTMTGYTPVSLPAGVGPGRDEEDG